MCRSRIWIALVVAMLATGCAAGTKREDRAYSFVTIGDNRSNEPIVQPQAYLDNIENINSLMPQPAFVIIVGDLILGGADDRDLILKEWREFDRVTAKIKAPVRLVPGNHDIWNKESYEIYKERYGPTYYSFDYGNSHFIALCSEEQGEGETGHITGAQFEWLANDLEEHKDAENTFVFLHQPLWAAHRGMAGSGWNENVHPLLARYGVDIVFAGHDHQFLNYGVRDGVQYYVTGGGGVPTSGIGGFHHFMLTTVDRDKVSSVVIDTEGQVRPHDCVTLETQETFDAMSTALALGSVKMPEEGNQIIFSHSIKNPIDKALEIRYEFDSGGTSWKVEPASGVVRLPAGGRATMEFTATFDRERLLPVPTLQCTVLAEGKEATNFSTQLQPAIRRRTTAVRLAESPVIDGVVSEGEYGGARLNSGFVEHRGIGRPEHDTGFLVAYDREALYIAVIAKEPDPGAIVVRPRDRDGEVWQDDDIEVFIDANLDRTTYRQFLVNTDAVQSDVIGGPEHGDFGDVGWDAEWEAQVKIGEDRFVVEFAIPYKALGVGAPKPGDTWGLNVARERPPSPDGRSSIEISAWCVTYRGLHVPTHFGNVTFQ